MRALLRAFNFSAASLEASRSLLYIPESPPRTGTCGVIFRRRNTGELIISLEAR